MERIELYTSRKKTISMLVGSFLTSVLSAGLFWHFLSTGFSGKTTMMSILPKFNNGVWLVFFGFATIFTLIGFISCIAELVKGRQLKYAIDEI
jgi:CDP-diglyceride synthetase